jgi:hypothetical protein
MRWDGLAGLSGRCSAVQCSAVQCSFVWFGLVHLGFRFSLWPLACEFPLAPFALSLSKGSAVPRSLRQAQGEREKLNVNALPLHPEL